ncbi:hypothetical protein [Flavisolibacter tropicus]|uniref:DUF4252 domain-containing protein n=1 Tax=Flavisolibacter tropicus TaxID=1492898 RepID=A0A172TW82_9BACT|nr:hypothetical protein [Flavisolibacter tropicus]ANE51242.1 hypothetical protein SY85_12720 [Flavisolibacter tropicus]
MKTMKGYKYVLSLCSILIGLFSCSGNAIKAQSNIEKGKDTIRPFTAIIVNSFYAEAYSVATVLTDKQLKIIFKSDLEGVKDTIVFLKKLQFSDTLRQISEINLTKLKDYYSNPCIDDGSQVTVVIKKDNSTKTVHVSNFYQEEVGRIIYLVNSIIPEKYKVWYNRERLIADYKRCMGKK